MIDHVEVERLEGSFYRLTITGEGFGDRRGDVRVCSNGESISHVDIKHWSDEMVAVEVTDAALTVGGLSPGKATVEIVPLPGMAMEFDVNNREAVSADYDGLVARAEELGVKVDKRWGEERLRQEILSAERE